MEFKTICYEKAIGGVARIILNRPDTRNAMNALMIEELITALDHAENDVFVHVIELSGKGKAFCAGADLDWMQESRSFSESQNIEDARPLGILMNKLFRIKKVTVCVVHGSVYGGGIGFAACSDIVIAASDVKFCFSEVKLGLVPAVISPFVIQAIGARAARKYFLTAEVFSATDALSHGLVHEIAEPEALAATVQALHQQLHTVAPHARVEAKDLVKTVTGKPIDKILLNDLVHLIAGLRQSEEGREGMAAFFEKRLPIWATKKGPANVS